MDLPSRISCLFGTKEYVGLRRQLVMLREKLMNHSCLMEKPEIYNICSGSLGEGVDFPKSDDDLMFCQTNIRVVKTNREATERGDVLIMPSENSPGYCLLLDVRASCLENVIQIINEMPFLSSSLFIQFYLRQIEQPVHIHGPCLSGVFGAAVDADCARCISSSTWPDVATDWLTRNRSYNWPSSEMIQNIAQNGCHVVPIGDPDSPHCDHQWRISFSVAERTLMHSFNHVQFLVYSLLRLTLKRVIDKRFPDVLCSYFMKTTIFYSIENTSIHLWRESNLESCFKVCLSVLYDYVDLIYCPNFFIPEYNMIKRKINHTNRQQMLDIIRTVHAIGIVGVLHLSGESFCLDDGLSAQVMEWKLDIEFMFSQHLLKAFVGIEDFFQSIQQDVFENFTLNLFAFWRLLFECASDELINMIWRRGLNSCCWKMMDYIFTSSEVNKQNYRFYKTVELLTRIAFRLDATTGKLTMATYLYMVGKTESALCVIRELLSEYPPYAIDRSRDAIKSNSYQEVMCNRGYSIDYKSRSAYVSDHILQGKNMNAYPKSLRIWLAIVERIGINPLSYTFFLQSLCYLQLRNQTLLKKSTHCLVHNMDDLQGDLMRVAARMCVGIIKYVQGDSQAACRWLGSAYVMTSDFQPPYYEKFSRSILTYVACLLNKQFRIDIQQNANDV